LLFTELKKRRQGGALQTMTPTTNIPVGASATTSIEVTREMTVAHFHSHMPEVYGTPMMIYLMELAAAQAIQQYLPDGWVSVGALVQIEHLAATPVGFTVTARADVVEVSDRLVTFRVEAHDGVEKIGEGKHVRAPIQIERFEKSIKAKAAKKR
jgi:fluoroacetyl-CoA thioesterase